MEKMTVGEISAIMEAEFHGNADAFIDYISTDSRDVHGHTLFVAIEGERVDGHEFIKDVLAKSPNSFAVAQKPVENDMGRVLYVKETFAVLLQIAKAYRDKYNFIATAVTGSVGKTTTKELVAQVLMAEHSTLKSRGNNNNEIGLPKTVFRLDGDYSAAVFEMGMDKSGDIRTLTEIIRPQVAVITNIGVSHIESLGSREAIFEEKMTITDGMADGAALVLCGDDEFLAKVNIPRLKVIFYGIENTSAQVFAKDIKLLDNGSEFTISCQKGEFLVQLPALGRHNVYNALAAFAVGLELDISPEKMVRAIAEYEPSGMRQRVREHGGITMVEDCYNASPDSMRAALQTLGSYKCTGRRICVLADMLELGDIAKVSHAEAGALAAKNADIMFAYGELAKIYAQSAAEAGMKNISHFCNKRELTEALLSEIKSGDVVWFKGSRGMQLEEVLEDIYRI